MWLFQFQEVQLKGRQNQKRQPKSCVSIPRGAVKSGNFRQRLGVVHVFQFQEVQLKAKDGTTAASNFVVSIPRGAVKSLAFSLMRCIK